MSPFIHWENELPQQEVWQGMTARMIHTGKITIARFNIKAGTQLPLHHHPHEQISTILEGEFEMSIVIPSNAPHSGHALSDCVIIDVFQPSRDDYRVPGNGNR